jgi:fructosamine-3-kinase
LWLGSFGALSDGGGPALFDPACWYGLPESDLALMEVRGRPGKAFYEAYHAAWPKEDG